MSKFDVAKVGARKRFTRFKDLTGERFGRLVVVKEHPQAVRIKTLWECICDCGSHIIVHTGSLKSGNTKSCGCYKKDIGSLVHKKHGKSKIPEYRIWKHLIYRCTKPSDKMYMYYGGRGITVCERWLNDFEAFLEDMGPCPKGMTLDRIDNNGNYEPGNCRWTTAKEQNRNKRNNRIVKVGEREEPLAYVCEFFSINRNTLNYFITSSPDSPILPYMEQKFNGDFKIKLSEWNNGGRHEF